MAKLNYSNELQQELVKMYEDECKSLAEISREKHISVAKIKELLISNGIDVVAFKSKIRTQAQKDQIIDLYENQMIGCDKIAEITGIPTRQINKFLHDVGKINPVGKTKKHKCSSDYFHEINTTEKAYWLGVLYADGNIRSNTPEIKFSAKDKEWVEAFLNAVNSTDVPHKETHSVYKTEIWKARISDDDMHADLKLHGCIPQKSLILHFPNLSEDLIPHFIRGYFDGDGTVGIYNNSTKKDAKTLRSGFCCGSEEFLKELCKKLPVKTTTVKRNKRDNNGAGCVYTVSFSVNDSLKLYIYIYKDATIWLNRKKEIFDNFIKQRRSETIIKTSLTEEEKKARSKEYHKKYYEEHKKKMIAQVSEKRRIRKQELKMKE